MPGNTAEFSKCRTYRYSLWRDLNMLHPEMPGYVLFIGLNPSTADENLDDPTIRRCKGFAQAWGYGSLCMANLFAYRNTEPAAMKVAADPIGIENDWYLQHLATNASLVVAAWGTHGAYMNRGDTVRKMIPNLHYLRLTKSGFPEHPLYLPGDLVPQKW